jgi:hypothetical protein
MPASPLVFRVKQTDQSRRRFPKANQKWYRGGGYPALKSEH